MAETEQPQLYLITPPAISLSRFPDQLANLLDRVEIACLRLALATTDEAHLRKSGDVIRAVAHERDVPIVIERHIHLATELGLDGVHLSDGARSVRAARKVLTADAIVGAFCGTSRHEGMTAGETGADYAAFGPVAATSLGDGTVAEAELFAWWSEMIEVPVVAEGSLDLKQIEALAPVTDFFGIGPEIWGAEDPAAALTALTAPLR